MLRGKILKAISGDFKIKLLSILVAFSMWVFVMEEIDPKTIRSVKNIQITEITNIIEIEHEGLTLSYNQNLITNIDFRGKRSALADFVRETPKIKATIENPRVGLNEVILSIDVPNNIEYSFDPAIIKVNLEESVTEDRTVGYATSGEVLSGFEVVGVSLSEENINIEVDLNIYLKEGENPRISAVDVDGNFAEYIDESLLIEKSIKSPATKDIIKEQLCKTQDTVFVVKKIDFDIDENIFLSKSKLNHIRRNVLCELMNLREKNHIRDFKEIENRNFENIYSKPLKKKQGQLNLAVTG